MCNYSAAAVLRVRDLARSVEALSGRDVTRSLPSVPSRPAWHADAACRGRLDVMFGGVDRYGEAAALCASCTVFAQCAADPEPGIDLYGYRAGLSPEQRRARARVA